MTVFSSKAPSDYFFFTLVTDGKFDDLHALFALLLHLRNNPSARIQLVPSDVKDMVGIKKFLARAVRESGFHGVVTYAQGGSVRDVEHPHEELFSLGKDEPEPKWAMLTPCNENWGAIVLAPFCGLEWSIAKAGFTFHALGHNYTSSVDAQGIPFGAKHLNYIYNHAVSMNNFASYDGPEGGRFTKEQLQPFANAFPIARESLKFALRNSIDFMAKQIVKACVKYNIPLADGVDTPTETEHFIKVWTTTYAKELFKNHQAYLEVVEKEIYPAMLKEQAKGGTPKPVPSLDEKGNVLNPTGQYLDRVWEQMRKEVMVECTDGQHLLVLLYLSGMFVEAYVGINPENNRIEFGFDGNVTSTMTVARSLKRAQLDDVHDQEFVKRCKLIGGYAPELEGEDEYADLIKRRLHNAPSTQVAL